MKALRTMSAVMAVAMLAVPVQVSTQQFGSIRFPTSGAPAAQEAFLTGVKALHNFQFDEAAVAFQQAQKADPTLRDGLLGRGDEPQPPAVGAAGPRRRPRRRSSKLAPTHEARLAKAKLPKEKAFLEAMQALYFGPGDKLARDLAYSAAMARMYEQWPDDHEVGTFYALSLLGTRAARRRRLPPPGLGRVDCREDLRQEPQSPGRRALHHPLVRRSRSRAAGARGGQRLREDRAVGRARAPHALAHLRAARHVAAGRRTRTSSPTRRPSTSTPS